MHLPSPPYPAYQNHPSPLATLRTWTPPVPHRPVLFPTAPSSTPSAPPSTPAAPAPSAAIPPHWSPSPRPLPAPSPSSPWPPSAVLSLASLSLSPLCLASRSLRCAWPTMTSTIHAGSTTVRQLGHVALDSSHLRALGNTTMARRHQHSICGSFLTVQNHGMVHVALDSSHLRVCSRYGRTARRN